jgi:hypothetical protein
MNSTSRTTDSSTTIGVTFVLRILLVLPVVLYPLLHSPYNRRATQLVLGILNVTVVTVTTTDTSSSRVLLVPVVLPVALARSVRNGLNNGCSFRHPSKDENMSREV